VFVWIHDGLKDSRGADYFEKIWSLNSCYSRLCVVYGTYVGSVEPRQIRDIKREICPPNATLGFLMGALVHIVTSQY
jgi:hypothetical protein